MERELLFFCTKCHDKSDEEIARIKCSIEHTVKRYKKGEYLAYQGDTITHLFFLTKGSVKTLMVSFSGRAIEIEELSAPYPLAAAFLFAEDNHFPVDVIAVQDVEVIIIAKEIIEKQMAKCNGFLRGFLAFNANRVRFLSDRLKLFSQKGIKAKIAYYILQRDKYGHFDFGRSITALAEYFGVERPSLSRSLSEMVKDGIIEYKDGTGKITDYNQIR